MKIQISNGEIYLKEFCSRKLKKEINKVLFNKVTVKNNDGINNLEGFSMEDMDQANDVALLGMVEKVVINNEEKKIIIETFDEMNTNDIEKIISEINKITTKNVPKD